MPDGIRRIGANIAHELPESGTKRAVDGGYEITTAFQGARDVIEPLFREIGFVDGGLGTVRSCVITNESGGDSKIETVWFTDTTTGGGFVNLGNYANPRIEISFQQLEQPLEAHPTIGLLSAGLPDYDKLAKLEAWKDAPPTRKRQWQIPKSTITDPDVTNDADWEALPDDVKKIAGKLAAGQDSFPVFSPVVKRITVTQNKPSVSQNGKVSTPPETPAGSPAYVFVKFPDSATQRDDGYWELVETWQGALSWDPDIYGAAT